MPLWLRGGFPDSLLAASDIDSLAMRQNFIRTYLERDVPMFGPRIPAERLERFWKMLAHVQGSLLNASRLASFYRTSAGAEIDLILEMGARNGTWAIEIKRPRAPHVEKGYGKRRLPSGPSAPRPVHLSPTLLRHDREDAR